VSSTPDSAVGIVYDAGRSGAGAPVPPASSSIPRSARRLNPGDFVFKHITLLFAALVLSLVFLMAYEMYLGSKPALGKFGWGFLVHTVWDPVQDDYGALTFIFGTIASSLLALLMALPLSLGVAVFLAELAPRWIERPLSFLVELLAAIPSIVYGLWGIFVLAPWLRAHAQPFLGKELGFLPLFKGPNYGFGMLAAGLILAVMILPIITSISRDVLKSVPDSYREAALGLGATRWETTRIILKDARSGIFGAALLGLGRALGETMAVTMVIGNRPEISASLFNPAYTMASVLANEFAEATTSMYTAALIEIALVLFVVTVLLNALARLVVWSFTKRFARS
jgi:phosphate transport system permease protein